MTKSVTKKQKQDVFFTEEYSGEPFEGDFENINDVENYLNEYFDTAIDNYNDYYPW